jgi:hypothetical protein
VSQPKVAEKYVSRFNVLIMDVASHEGFYIPYLWAIGGRENARLDVEEVQNDTFNQMW